MAVAFPADRRCRPIRTLTQALSALLTAVLLIAGLATPATGAPKPTIKQLKKELAALRKQSDKLITEYYNGRIAHQKAEKAERAAKEKLTTAQTVYDRESAELRLMAVAAYTNGGPPNSATMLAGNEDPSALMGRLALSQHLIDQQNASLRGFAQVRDEHKQAQKEAAARAKELGAQVADLGKRKDKAERLIKKIKDKIDKLYKAPGVRRSDGTWVPQLPGGSDNITPRMRLVKTLIQERFAVPNGIGCYRAIQDGGEHPLGRACDFMLSRGGSMPTGAEVARGNEIAAWAIKNAKRLGIMYIIYRQRIWHAGSGAWRTMSDRGGTTANHYDHPHISVY